MAATAQLDRVRVALTASMSSADVGEALRSAQADLASIDEQLATARQVALDPLSSRDGAEQARATAERLSFDRDRALAAIAALGSRQTAVSHDEITAAAAARRKAAEDERDSLAVEIAERYPVLAAELVSLLSRIAANDARLAAVGISSDSAEAIARGCPGNFYDGGIPISRLIAARLPAFDPGRPPLWTERSARTPRLVGAE